jgi:aminopeptidase N
MNSKTLRVLFILIICWRVAPAQQSRSLSEQVFTRADTLRGMLTPVRTCYDVSFYHLDVRIDPDSKSIKGSNEIKFKVIQPFDTMQVDLFANMQIEKIMWQDSALMYHREFNAVFIHFPKKLEKNADESIRIYYSGQPQVAKRPPWEGGFTWAEDSAGNPWVVVTCQGTGASLWWPNKDHQSDEPDSMMISVTVPPGLLDISNGRLRNRTELSDGWVRHDWFVSYPINNYNVTVSIGKYVHFDDVYADGDTLTLDYYVLPENLSKARAQFKQVKPMLSCFEKYFGEYPFVNDGYKLVECPHTGMEHQSAVAYGNHYIQGYRGRASSEVGLKFDFIIIHESAHEWWGNSVTSKDVADMWIHESFAAYAEALYVECMYGYQESLKYINGKKTAIGNSSPIIGVYNVNKPGSGDMYNKGQLVLNTLRSVINNDSLWFAILRGISTEFKYQTITSEDIFRYINVKIGTDYQYLFDQYLKFPRLPRLEASVIKRGTDVRLRYRWVADVPEFRMPIKVTLSRGRFEFIRPTTTWQSTPLALEPEEFRVAEDLFYIDLRLDRLYLDPNTPNEPRP